MQKVKVHRYVSGKRPDYALDHRSDSESEDEDFLEKRTQPNLQFESPERQVSDEDGDVEELDDPRLRRLKIRENDTEVRPERRRHVIEPEVLDQSDDEVAEEIIHLPGQLAHITIASKVNRQTFS